MKGNKGDCKMFVYYTENTCILQVYKCKMKNFKHFTFSSHFGRLWFLKKRGEPIHTNLQL